MGESTYCVPYFNFFYYIFLVPFKTTLDNKTNRYYAQSNFIQKLLCSFLQVIVVTDLFYCNVVYYLCQQTNDPLIVVALDGVFSAATIFGITSIFKLVWKDRQEFMKMIEHTRLNVSPTRVRVIQYFTYIILAPAVVLMAALNWQLLQGWSGTYSEDSQELGINNFNKSMSSHNEDAMTIKCLKFVYDYGINSIFIHAGTSYPFFYGIPIVLVLSLKELAKEFNMKLEVTIVQNNFNAGLRLQRQLKRTTDMIRDLFGNILVAYFVVSVSYYAQVPHILLGKRGMGEIVFVAYFGLTSVVWIFAANFHQNVRKSLLKWIQTWSDDDNLSVVDRLKLVTLSNEITTDPIALSSNYFPVTYAHISSMLGLILTYGIIVFQLHTVD